MLKNTLTRRCLTTLFLLGLTGSAYAMPATTYMFNLAGQKGNYDSLTVWDSTHALKLNATGFASPGNYSVSRNGAGLGVKRKGFFGFFDDPQLDGLGPDETLRLDIAGTASYRLWEVGYGAVGGNDDYKLIVDGTEKASGDLNGHIDYSMANITGNIFDFTVLGFNDDYRVEWFKIKSIHPSAVPVPGSLALLGIGFVGMAFSMRRKAVAVPQPA